MKCQWFFISALTVVLSSCGNSNSSSVDQIHANALMACKGNQERIPRIAELYTKNIGTSDQRHINDAIDALSVLPDFYLDWVIRRNNLKIRITSNGGGGGFTTWGGQRITSMSVGGKSPGGNYYSLRHEMGHAVHVYLSNNVSGFSDEWNRVYNQALRQEGRAMRSYARSSPYEFFADLFDSFYCEEASNQLLQKNLPISYAFAQKYLIPFGELNGPNQNPQISTPTNLSLYLHPSKDDQTKIILAASDANQFTKLMLCKGTKAECTPQTDQSNMLTLTRKGKIKNNNLYMTPYWTPQMSMVYTLLGYYGTQLIRTRSFSLEAKLDPPADDSEDITSDATDCKDPGLLISF